MNIRIKSLIDNNYAGKTELIYHICKALGRELHIQDMGTIQDSQSALLGVHRIKEGHSVFEPSPFIGYLKDGSVILLDELNRKN